jgi:hypothetical protein
LANPRTKFYYLTFRARFANLTPAPPPFGENIPGIDAELDDAEDEPSLGASEHHPLCPSSWSASRPGEFRDRSGNQSLWECAAPSDDREDDAGDNPEHDEAEHGIADEDGLIEQRSHRVL